MNNRNYDIFNIHFMNKSNKSVTDTFMKFVDSNFSEGNNIFVVRGSSYDGTDGRFDHVEYLESKSFIPYLRCNSHKIFIHGLCINLYEQIYLLFHPKAFGRLYWIAWGSDLYDYKQYKGLIRIFYSCFQHFFRKRIRHFIGIFPPDIEYFQEKIGTRASVNYCPYVLMNYGDGIPKKEDVVAHKTINIVIGHQANPVLHHFDTLDILKKYAKEDIHIYIPLSYGDADYADEVEKYSQRLFGNKVTCIRDYMDYSTYIQYLCTMDIVIFNTYRQIGLGNILVYLKTGKKIFMPENSVMYRYYHGRGINIQKYEEIESNNFESFVETVDMEAAIRLVEQENCNRDFYVSKWQEVL